jgi:hypothetical protein
MRLSRIRANFNRECRRYLKYKLKKFKNISGSGMNNLEQKIIDETKGLSPGAAAEVLGFIRRIKRREEKKRTIASRGCDLDDMLREMEEHELTHLEQEMEGYKEIYPYEE